MPRYHFHIRNDFDVDDEEGSDHADLAAAREHAIECARDLMCADIRQGWVDLDHRIIVTDHAGTQILTLTFRDAFELRGLR